MADMSASIARGDRDKMDQLRAFLAKALLDMRREGFEHKRVTLIDCIKLIKFDFLVQYCVALGNRHGSGQASEQLQRFFGAEVSPEIVI